MGGGVGSEVQVQSGAMELQVFLQFVQSTFSLALLCSQSVVRC